MKYICPTCNRRIATEEEIVKHYLKCWRDKNPNHKSKSAPRSANIEVRKVNSDITDFFNSIKE